MGKQNINTETRSQRAARQQREQDAQFDSHIINTKCTHYVIKTHYIKGKGFINRCNWCGEIVEKYL